MVPYVDKADMDQHGKSAHMGEGNDQLVALSMSDRMNEVAAQLSIGALLPSGTSKYSFLAVPPLADYSPDIATVEQAVVLRYQLHVAEV